MNEKDERNREIKDFLKQIEEKLPGWLKDHKKELKNIKAELEEHIWDKAEDLARGEGGEPNIIHVRTAIAQMGSPRAIAKEYKKRGTPKIYITEELYPYYIKILRIIISVVVGLNIIGLIVDLINNRFLEGLGGLSSGIITGSVYGVLIVSFIFVGFSMEGFMPEDFNEFADEGKKNGHKHKSGKKKKAKKPLKLGELISNGTANIIFGSFIIMMPFESINIYLGPVFVAWIQVTGVFTFIKGIINMMQASIGIRAITGQQILIIVVATIELFLIPWYFKLGSAFMTIPAIVALDVEIIAIIFTYLPYLIVLILSIELIEAIVKSTTYRSKLTEFERQNQ